MTQTGIAIIVNLLVIIFAIIGTAVLVKKLQFDDNNSRIIFLLYILYWIAPLLCRDYTSNMNIHFGLNDGGKLMWIPVAIFGFVGILWRPLNDILTYKAKSRKFVIYVSLLIQLVTVIAFLLYPCFATNIVQSVGTGIGASGIGLFTLMFNENQKHHKKWLSISIFALPPIVAGFIVSAIESFVACCVPSQHTEQQYVSVVWYIWLIALISILVSFIIAFFVKERRNTLYQDKQNKQPIKKPSSHWKLLLLCLAGACLTFFRWAASGPFAGMQLSVIAKKYSIDTSLWDGYLGLVYSLGCLIGTAISGVLIVKCRRKVYQPILIAVAVFILILYVGFTVSFVNVPVYFWMNILSGLGFGLMWNIFMNIVLNMFYAKHDIVTPIGFFNMSLSIGMVLGSLFVGMTKGKFYDFHVQQTNWDEFIRSNYSVGVMLMIACAILLLAFVGYYLIDQKYENKTKTQKKCIAMIGENEL